VKGSSLLSLKDILINCERMEKGKFAGKKENAKFGLRKEKRETIKERKKGGRQVEV